MRAVPLPQARLAGIAWLDRLQNAAALVSLTQGLFREATFYPRVRCCDSCAVPLEEAQPYFFGARHPVPFYCLDCTYEMVRAEFRGFPEPPSTLVVSLSDSLGKA